jgi:hypothetical protein
MYTCLKIYKNDGKKNGQLTAHTQQEKRTSERQEAIEGK